MIVTHTQQEVLQIMLLTPTKPLLKPRNSLERLEKKGLVHGNRKYGWLLTTKGLSYIKKFS